MRMRIIKREEKLWTFPATLNYELLFRCFILVYILFRRFNSNYVIFNGSLVKFCGQSSSYGVTTKKPIITMNATTRVETPGSKALITTQQNIPEKGFRKTKAVGVTYTTTSTYLIKK